MTEFICLHRMITSSSYECGPDLYICAMFINVALIYIPGPDL